MTKEFNKLEELLNDYIKKYNIRTTLIGDKDPETNDFKKLYNFGDNQIKEVLSIFSEFDDSIDIPLIINTKRPPKYDRRYISFDYKGSKYSGTIDPKSMNDLRSLLNKKRSMSIITEKSLEEMFGEDIAYSLKQNIGRDIQNVSNLGTVSFNKVYDGKLKDTNEEVIIKVTNNYQKAKIECLANYYLSQHPVLGKVIALGVIEEPVALEDGVWLTVQKKVHDKKEYSTMHYISSLALLHSYGKGIMSRNAGIILPEWEAKSFDELLDNIAINENPAKFKHLKQRYNEIAHELRTRPEYVLIHGDAKKDNLTFGKLLDLEGIKNGHPSIDLSICLAQSGIPTEHWDKYLGIYCDIVKNETGINYTHNDLKQLTDLTKKAYVVTGLNEYSGISSRPIRKQQNYQMQQLLFGLI